MPRVPNQFVNPANNQSYQWPVNHASEEPVNKSRQMGDGAPSSDIGLIPQQGAATPLILQLKGSIFDPAHLTTFNQWWALCEGQSIYYYDFSGGQYEVLITDFEPQVKGVARNPKFPELTYMWEYTMILRVLSVFAGPWLGVKP